MKQDIASKEELYFEWFLQELLEADYIDNFTKAKTYELSSIVENIYIEQLKTKNKEKNQTIINGHNYSPDFEIHWNIKAKNIFFQSLDRVSYNNNIFNSDNKLNKNFIWANQIKYGLDLDKIGYGSLIEIKGGFSLHGQLQNNAVDRKWLFQKYGLYVNLVKIPDLFKDTFCPTKFLLTDSGRQNRIIHFPVKTLQQFIELKTNNNNNNDNN